MDGWMDGRTELMVGNTQVASKRKRERKEPK